MRFSAATLEPARATASGELLGQPFEARLVTVPIAQVLRAVFAGCAYRATNPETLAYQPADTRRQRG